MNDVLSMDEKQALIQRWQAVKNAINAANTVKKTSQEQEKITSEQLPREHTRLSQEVMLLAVSKTKPASMIAALAEAGQRDFGENYLQEALDKIVALKTIVKNSTIKSSFTESSTIKSSVTKSAVSEKDGGEGSDKDKTINMISNPITWHYIGHIQRNKTRDIAAHFDWVHTIEREIIAKRLNEQRPEDKAPLNVLIQVNIDNEDTKSGCLPEDVPALIDAIKGYDNLCLRGLMIIPAKDTNNQSADAFIRTKQLFDTAATNHPELSHWDTLSMGMSGDMEEAIKHGSTMVRVGSSIFGTRD